MRAFRTALVFMFACALGCACTLITKETNGAVERKISFGVMHASPVTERTSVVNEHYLGFGFGDASMRVGAGKKSQILIGKTDCVLVVLLDEVPSIEPPWLSALRAQASAGLCVINQEGN